MRRIPHPTRHPIVLVLRAYGISEDELADAIGFDRDYVKRANRLLEPIKPDYVCACRTYLSITSESLFWSTTDLDYWPLGLPHVRTRLLHEENSQ